MQEIKNPGVEVIAGSAIETIEISFRYTQAFLYFRRRLWNAAALLTGDLFSLSLAVVIAGAIRWWWFGEAMFPPWNWLLLLFWSIGASVARLLPSWGMGAVEELRRIVIFLAGIFGSVAVFLFIGKQGHEVSRFVLFSGFTLSVFLVPLTRMTIKKMLVYWEIWGIPTVIYGNQETSCRIIQALRENKGFGYVPIGVFNNSLTKAENVSGVPVLGGMEQSTTSASVAIIAVPGIAREKLVELLDGPLAGYRRIMIIPDLFEVQSLWVQTRDLGGILGLEVSRNLLNPISWSTKRLLELLAVAVLSVMWLPLCLLLALIIWLESRANPFFLQERIGKDGRAFKTWKFRTMVPDAEKVLREKLDEDPQLCAEWQANFKLKNDPRITRVGLFLRKTSLDELPQLINVLCGEMSLVGPRPLPKYHHEELNTQTKSLRERVRPGLTGLWQVSGRSDAGTQGMQRWDTYYVRNWSVWLDVVILIRTIKTVMKGGGAY